MAFPKHACLTRMVALGLGRRHELRREHVALRRALAAVAGHVGVGVA